MSATLGGLIKDYRLQKNLSQLEIAFALGWKEPSRLSRIEQGRVGNPKRKLLDRLMEAMRLSEEEKNRLMLVGNYVPMTIEISRAVKKVSPIVSKWHYPVVMYDYLWRIVDENTHAAKLYQAEKVLGKSSAREYPHVLELMFHPDFAQNKLRKDSDLEEWKKGLMHLLIHFRHAHSMRTKERWYMELVARMMNTPLFRQLWNESQDIVLTDVLVQYSARTLILPSDPKHSLHFNIFYVPVREDPRFTLEFHTPSDASTMKAFE